MTHAKLRRTASRSFALLLLALTAGACTPRFTVVTPNQAATCDFVEIGRDDDRRHRCGFLEVALDGVPATETCLEGTGLKACVPPRTGTDLVFKVPATWPAGPGTLSVRQSIRGTGCALLGAFGSDTYEFPFTVTEQLQAPRIMFDADSERLAVGESTTLRWNVTGTTTAINLDSDAVPASGTRIVSPTASQTYSLRAENSCEGASKPVSICVDPVQQTPVVTGIDSARPGERVRIDGRELAFSNCDGDAVSEVVFTQDGTTYPPAVDGAPATGRLDITLPSSLSPGAATAVARVGSLESAPFPFTVEGRANGAFRAVTLHQSGTHDCGSGGREVSISESGGMRIATFRQGGRSLADIPFTLGTAASGAALSPDCQHGVVVGRNTARGDGSYTLHVYDLDRSATPHISAQNLGSDVQVLFSPDDTVVLYKAQDSSRGVDFATVDLYDMLRGRSLSGPGSEVACTACSSISASVAGFREVAITFDGRSLGVYPIE
ncbi:MAG: hypothetical protein AAGD01_18305 [Acidobacteriota bacterium]